MTSPVADTRRRPAVLSGALIVVACVATLVAIVGGWAGRNLLDTDRFLSRMGPTIEDPAVQDAVAGSITAQVMTVLDPQALLTEAFEERPAARLLAGPLAGAFESFVRDRVDAVVASDAFARWWNVALERAHGAAMLVLRGDGDVLVAEGDVVRLDLTALVQEVLARISDESPGLLGNRTIDAPSVGAAADAIRSAVERVTGRTLDEDFGQLVVYDGGKLAAAQQMVDRFERLLVLAAIVAVAAAAAALWASRDRRRTGLQLVVGLGITLVVLRRATARLVEEVHAIGAEGPNGDAVDVVLGRLVDPLRTFTGGAILAVVLVAGVLAVTGPYPWAVRLRGAVTSGAAAVRGRGAALATDDATVEWVRAHHDGVVLGLVGAGLSVLWFADLGWFGLALVIAVVAAGVGWANRLA